MNKKARRRGDQSAQVGDAPGVVFDDSVLNPVRLAVLRTVVERRSFSRAAEVLLMTPSAVTLHVQALERLWGRSLFERRRGAQLTEAGQAAYDYAMSVLSETAAVRARLRDLAGGEAGTVTLGAATVPTTYVLPRLLARFRRQYPAAQVRLRGMHPALVGEEVLAGRCDFGIVGVATALPALRAEPLWVDTTVLIAPPDHPLAQRARVTVADLAGQPFVIGGASTLGDRALDQLLQAAALPPRQIVLEIGNHEGIKQAVHERMGLGILFRRAVERELAAGELVALQIDELPMAEQFLLVYRRTHRFTPIAQNLIAFLRAEAAVIDQA